MDDRVEIAETLVDFHCTLKVKAEMDQFLVGLEAAGLRIYLQSHPDVLKPLFTYTKQTLTAEQLKNMLNAKFSDRESQYYQAEKGAYIHFADFLDECADEDIGCTLQDVMIFFSGSDRVPPVDFDQHPKLEFLHDDRNLPISSTFDLEMRIPIRHTTYDTFKHYMVLGLKSNDGFGGT